VFRGAVMRMWRLRSGSDLLSARAFSSWVHPSVADDAVLAARHAAMISSHMLGGLLAAVVFAGYFALVDGPRLVSVVACACFLAPIGIALLLQRSGRLDIAHLLSALQLTALVSLAAALTGGAGSFAIAWLLLVPLEAALSGEARTTAIATCVATAAGLALSVATAKGILPAPISLPFDSGIIAAVGLLGAIAYAGMLGASVIRIQQGAARDVRASRERYRLIAENANDLVTRHDECGGVLFASLASKAILAREPDALLGTGFEEALAPEDRNRYRASIRRALESGKPVSEEYQLGTRSRDGWSAGKSWVEMRCQPVATAGSGRASRHDTVIAVTRDITLRKDEMRELAASRDEAQRISRAKSAFLATMSHELRTPLNAIIGFAELLHREMLIKERDPRHAEQCRIIHQSGEHLLSLVKDLLDISKIESGRFSVVPESFTLADVAVQAAETLHPAAKAKEIDISVDLQADLPELFADRRATRQILINLISNAVKFTPPRGRVTVRARRSGGAIEIEVSDTGFGIAPEHMARLGQPFYQVETSYARQNDGAGLGLSIVFGLVQLSQGSIRIESEPGRGSRFVVTLPADVDADVTADAEGSIAPTVAVTAPSGKGGVVVALDEVSAQLRARRSETSQADASAEEAHMGPKRAAAG
jgi:cell cycle sensor histidine kinase DivJ